MKDENILQQVLICWNVICFTNISTIIPKFVTKL